MSSYLIGITAGLSIGTILGFTFCALLVTAKRADKQAMDNDKNAKKNNKTI